MNLKNETLEERIARWIATNKKLALETSLSPMQTVVFRMLTEPTPTAPGDSTAVYKASWKSHKEAGIEGFRETLQRRLYLTLEQPTVPLAQWLCSMLEYNEEMTGWIRNHGHHYEDPLAPGAICQLLYAHSNSNDDPSVVCHVCAGTGEAPKVDIEDAILPCERCIATGKLFYVWDLQATKNYAELVETPRAKEALADEEHVPKDPLGDEGFFTINTYNYGGTILDQDIKLRVFTCEGTNETYALINVHGGVDARWGYGDSRAFTAGSGDYDTATTLAYNALTDLSMGCTETECDFRAFSTNSGRDWEGETGGGATTYRLSMQERTVEDTDCWEGTLDARISDPGSNVWYVRGQGKDQRVVCPCCLKGELEYFIGAEHCCYQLLPVQEIDEAAITAAATRTHEYIQRRVAETGADFVVEAPNASSST